ncbi:uncharacterized protein LY89DRAFT_702070 [Mollisia scopiformis]|uniref:Homeobox domain-containing protein n=1 Tax=Mollisia scopiformis TaxID=149040 RepID=A0A132B6K2_MOLSC|nr:uncharacterized protein LY89DRAFT_702070 [Mollisia scopiformis]KUJ07961.1 hypothetical protein LY89DRAFT_702070 [Mollisia scopiformis]
MMALPNAAKTSETRPRLGKEEVDILEASFRKNPKPTTQTKRGFAEDMGVDLARINNWFQNRRAKRKQEKKQEAYEAGQAEQALGFSEPSSPDFYSHSNGYFSDPQLMPMAQSSASFPMMNGPPPAVAGYNPQYTDPSTASLESLQRTLAVANAADHDEYHDFVDQRDAIGTFNGSLGHDFSTSDRVQFPSPEHGLPHFDDSNAQTYSSYTTHFSSGLYNEGQPLEVQSPPEEANNQTPTPFNTFSGTSGASHLLTTFPSQLLPTQNQDTLSRSHEEHDGSSPEDHSASSIGFQYDMSEPDNTPPPAASIPFKSPPPPSDIASRRKKVQVKPTALATDTLRSSRPSLGPRTVSHAEGFRRPIESPIGSPMRRIASAGGNRNVLSGRVFKSGIESSQRSPINFGTFESAGAFMEHNFHNIRHPSLTASSSLNSSLAPPTPMSPRGEMMTLVKREGPRSTASPVENFIFNAGTGGFTTLDGDQSLSPPETPQAPMALNPSHNWAHTLDFAEKQWQYEVPDEPLFTPAHDTFPIELHMPQPSYLTSMSQPVTPAFGQFNPNFMFGHESPQFTESPKYTLSTQTGSEYSFPDASPHHYLGLSPTMTTTKQKTFQFSHTTAADFSEK